MYQYWKKHYQYQIPNYLHMCLYICLHAYSMLYICAGATCLPHFPLQEHMSFKDPEAL